jgi:tRNA threonylcarbamoyladenosine biosynthesis protein TsaB
MLILTIKTDQPDAELTLFDNQKRLTSLTWPAHRQLAETIHYKMRELLTANARQLTDLEAVAVFAGPGSFTGLRIGISVANALADSLQIPIVGGSGESWRADCVEKLLAGKNDEIVVPEYGSPPHITPPKH